jgi:hypothetical protein
MNTKFHRREILALGATAAGSLFFPAALYAAEAPSEDPTATLKLDWTKNLAWDRVVDLTSIPGTGEYWDKRLIEAQGTLVAHGGGVVYFPPGTYAFEQHIQLLDGVILRGGDPSGPNDAIDARYRLPSKIEFPKYIPLFKGDGTPIDTAFKGIYLAQPEKAANCGVVNLDINRGHIHFLESEAHACGGNRLVFGCILRNAAVADPAIPTQKITQHPWQRFTSRHHAAIELKGAENLLVANNRLPESGDENFIMKDCLLKPSRGSSNVFDVEFDYDNRPGLYVSHYCVGGSGGSGKDGTPESHPYGFRKGIVIRDNYVFNTGRMSIGFGGDGTICSSNVTRIKKDVFRPTVTGESVTHGSSTNDNRAIEMRGWRWTVDGNDCEVHKNWCADRSYYINDGEGIMHEDHCNSDIRDSRLTNNTVNSYLSLYKCGLIDGLVIEGNDVSTPGKIADIFVVADRNSGPQPCRNVTISNNVTRSNGILIQGAPAANNVVKDNRHQGGGGSITNNAQAKLSGNQGY